VTELHAVSQKDGEMGAQLGEHEDQVQGQDRVPRKHRAIDERAEGKEDDEQLRSEDQRGDSRVEVPDDVGQPGIRDLERKVVRAYSPSSPGRGFSSTKSPPTMKARLARMIITRPTCSLRGTWAVRMSWLVA
jgi:hypothetical protein